MRAVAVNSSLAVILPALGCVLYWRWISLSTTARECVTGSSGSNWGLAVFLLLVLLTPGGVILHAWRKRVPTRYAALAAVTGAGIAFIAIFLTYSVWWSGHGCMT